MVERTAHNRVAAGSIPATATSTPVTASIAASGLLAPPGPVLVGLSGGPDSTALLHGLLELGVPVVAAHFDHALRPDSAAEALAVHRQCDAIGVRLLTARREVPLPAGSVPAGARRLRYEFLEGARVEAGAEAVALGHQADDLVEGVLLHLLRGTGLAGLRGMPHRRGRIIRPLLGVWRAEIEADLAARSLVPLRDPANADLRFARARVRHRLLPALEAARPGISRRLHALALDAAARQSDLEARVDSLGAGAADLRRAAPALQAEALRRLYAAAGGPQPGLSRRHLRAMRDLLAADEGGRVDLPGRIRFECGSGAVEMLPAPDPSPIAHRLVHRRCPGCSDPGAVHLRPGLALRVGSRAPGLRMRVRGAGTRKLQDMLVDAGVPRWRRDALPLVFSGDELAWVPGVAVGADFVAPPGTTADHVTIETIGDTAGGEKGRVLVSANFSRSLST